MLSGSCFGLEILDFTAWKKTFAVGCFRVGVRGMGKVTSGLKNVFIVD
jgi:hypothetical protein